MNTLLTLAYIIPPSIMLIGYLLCEKISSLVFAKVATLIIFT